MNRELELKEILLKNETFLKLIFKWYPNEEDIIRACHEYLVNYQRKNWELLRKGVPSYKELSGEDREFIKEVYFSALEKISKMHVDDMGEFVLVEEYDWMKIIDTSSAARFRKRMNEAALSILDKDFHSDTDKLIIKSYTGKGGLGESGSEILTQYFTDYTTVKFVWDKLRQMGFKTEGIQALEPSCGIGNFIGLAPRDIMWDAIDIDPILINMVQILYPGVNSINKSFEDHTKDDFYDLVITNVPFQNSRGSGRVKDKPEIKKLHDYFMMASIDKLKPNGVAALIVPSSVMDGIDNRLRREIVEKAELITAYRLPNSVFIKTGTSVTTDLIFLRKKIPGELKSQNDMDFMDVGFPEKFSKASRKCALNNFYMQRPNNVLGTMAESKNRFGQYEIKILGLLSSYTDKALHDGVKYNPVMIDPAVEFSQEKNIKIDITETVPNNGLFKTESEQWFIKKVEKRDGKINEITVPIDIDMATREKVSEILKVAEAAYTMRMYKREGREVETSLSNLRKIIKNLNKKYPYLFLDEKLKKVMGGDPRYSIVKVLANDCDLISGRVDTKPNYSIKNNTDLDEISQYLYVYKQKITIEDLAQLYAGGTSIEKMEKIIQDTDILFKIPSIKEQEFHNRGEVTIKKIATGGGYERAIDYLSGNIYKKIEMAEYEVCQGNLEFRKNINALKSVLPTPKSLGDIYFSLKHKWIDLGIKENFINSLGYKVSILYDSLKSTFQVSFDSSVVDDEIRERLNIGFSFENWLEKYLNSQELIIYDSEGRKDELASSKVSKKMKIIDEMFMNYLAKNPEISSPLVDQYNYLFNNWKKKDYEIENLIIPGVGEGWSFRQNQLEAAWRAISLGTYINSHRVGGGKTATSALVNHMLKVMGKCKKPMQIVPGKVLKKFLRDIKLGSRGLPAIFPNMKILDVTLYSFNEAMAQIAYNNWDLILIPDTWYKRIDITPDREIEYVEKRKEFLILSEKMREKERGQKRSEVEFQKNLLALEEQLAQLRYYVKHDGIYFEDLGVDAVSLDEAQSVKNLCTSSRASELGISATPSQIALDFNIKAQYIMELNNGHNVFLYTATPVSNSILEIYGLIQNIAPYEWISRHIYSVDDFIDYFADISTTIGITTKNEVGVVKKIDGFINLEELRSLFLKYCDYRIEIEGLELPELQNELVISYMTPMQRIIFNSLLERLKTMSSNRTLDNTLKVLNEGRLASISESLITRKLPTLENSPKLKMLVEAVSKIYHNTTGNQIIFLDNYGDKNLKKNLHLFIQEELVKQGIAHKEIVIVNGKLNNSHTKKLEVQDAFNDGKYRILIGTTNSIGSGMDLQERTLVSHNIDIPWTPTSVDQRSGRMNRPGNRYCANFNLNYMTKGSYDAWSASIVAIKRKWQNQLFWGTLNSDRGYTKNNDESLWTMERIMAEIMEDPKERETMLLKSELMSIESEIKSIQDLVSKSEITLESINAEIYERENKIKEYESWHEKKKLAILRINQLKDSLTSLISRKSEMEDKVARYNNELEDLKYRYNIKKNTKVKESPKVINEVEYCMDTILEQIIQTDKDTMKNKNSLQTADIIDDLDSLVEIIKKDKPTKEPVFIQYDFKTRKRIKNKKVNFEQYTLNLDLDF